MMLCEHCSFTISPSHDGQCPRCGRSTPSSRQNAWVAIARVNNLAEVGYLADILEGDGLPTQIVQHNDFCAVSGAWHSIYMLCVAGDRRASAIERLKDELQHAGDDGWPPVEDGSRRRTATNAWRSMMLVIMAGGIAYYAGRGGLEQPRPVPLRESLWEALSESDQELVAEPAHNAPPRRLHFEQQSRTLVLEDDPDGDGQMRVRRYREGRLVEERVRAGK